MRHTWSSQTVLPLAVLGEARGEDEPVLQVDGLGALGSLVGHGLLLHVPVTWIHAADLPVLAREQHLTSVPVPAGAQHQLGQGEVQQTFTCNKIFMSGTVSTWMRKRDSLRPSI